MSSKAKTVYGSRLVIPQAYKCEFEVSEWDTAAVEEDSVLIRTEYTLISPGTELAFYTGTHIDLDNPANKWAKLPFYPGYASVGKVVAVGRLVHEVKVGQHVMALGHHAEYDSVPYSDDNIVVLPQNLNPRQALFSRLAEISSTALIQSSHLCVGKHVVVIGMGLIGNFAAQLYNLQGANTIGVDVVEKRLSIARATNIPHTIRTEPGMDLEAEVRKITQGVAPDIVVEATGNPALINVALDLVRPRGQVILLGSPRGTVEINIYKHIHSKSVSLTGAHDNVKGFDGLPSCAQLLRYVLRLISGHQLSVEPLISHTLPASQAQQAYELLLNQKDEALGVILDWRQRE